ncbi:MAG: PilZ domain-containing protein [Candidatus Omnitrophica bacterium]|nr:PilZ domain-containing protein [Candidatus Omnitrophota bacterium]
MKREDHLGRRKFYRLKATYLVNYRPKDDKSSIGNYNYALTKDISAGGLLVMSEKNFPKGTEMEMNISLPMYPDKRLKALGEVTSNFPADVKKLLYPTRIRFIEFNEAAFNKLKDFIENEMNKQKGGRTLKQKIDRRKE